MTSCLEKKILLSGEVHLYDCEFLWLRDGIGALKYVLTKGYRVSGIELVPGDVTYALYWTNRPYTLYCWRLKRPGGAIYYFNIADSVVLTPGEFTWRDLIVDVLIDAEGKAQVLDENELPVGLAPDLVTAIQGAKDHLLKNYKKIIVEAERLLSGAKT